MVAKSRIRPETWWLLRNLSRPFRSRTDPVAFPVIHTPTIISGGHLKSRRGQRLESGNSSATLTHSLTSLESQRLKKVTTKSDQRGSDSVQDVNMAFKNLNSLMDVLWRMQFEGTFQNSLWSKILQLTHNLLYDYWLSLPDYQSKWKGGPQMWGGEEGRFGSPFQLFFSKT